MERYFFEFSNFIVCFRRVLVGKEIIVVLFGREKKELIFKLIIWGLVKLLFYCVL